MDLSTWTYSPGPNLINLSNWWIWCQMPIRCQSVEQEDETINNLGVDSCFLESCRKNFRCIPLQNTSARHFFYSSFIPNFVSSSFFLSFLLFCHLFFFYLIFFLYFFTSFSSFFLSSFHPVFLISHPFLSIVTFVFQICMALLSCTSDFFWIIDILKDRNGTPSVRILKTLSLQQLMYTLWEKQSKFPRYNMKCKGKHDTTWNIPRSITFSPLHFMLYRGKLISFGTV